MDETIIAAARMAIRDFFMCVVSPVSVYLGEAGVSRVVRTIPLSRVTGFDKDAPQ